MDLFSLLKESIQSHLSNNALCINQKFYTYKLLADEISKIRKFIAKNISETEKIIGLVSNDDIETYSTILALWFEGKAYVPISPDLPKARILNILNQAKVNKVFDSVGSFTFDEFEVINSKNLPSSELYLDVKTFEDNQILYILFTSGTTGQPKGVPISLSNLSTFVEALNSLDLKINEQDRCLQMFELTFDLSIFSYLIPFLNGACIYTIPKDKIKYSYIFELLDEYQLTVALMVPSILHYLRPYFDEIQLPLMKYSLFCGEALHLDIVKEWESCIPNSKIINVYGPTEATIFCSHLLIQKHQENKVQNGVISIGQMMKGTSYIIIDENEQILESNNIGQLCLSGEQVTEGYWENKLKNDESFFTKNILGKNVRYYRTGDLCKVDLDGDLLYLGRVDYQIKIQGFRVELSEIEFQAKNFLKKLNIVAVSFQDKVGNLEIGLVLESKKIETEPLLTFLRKNIPSYMIPRRIEFVNQFELNSNGKIDRKKLEQLFY